ncbi:hypothetical protein M1M40_gp45 [Halorubrum tailed virus 29]|uniref:Uncharacterized protein n=1 Tax=Halorubrum tailed virus 29 TaxID=2878010 RepID=A0AAE8Y1R9_9CAUD|nr:hypothetical protein M1M40_gp45 [Halorubrum tailed virus 29]UBF23323.1 hypothetical protein HRTV-29_gp45 [Halorubrum tailed virus 29]
MQLRRSPGARAVDADWHEQRQRAREQAYSGDLDGFFSDTEIIKYDLETAQITGEDNPRLYIFNRTLDVFGVNGTDVRNLRDR